VAVTRVESAIAGLVVCAAALRCNCLLRGRKIRTTTGERRIEDPAIGDRLPTVFGGVRPIQWIARFPADKTMAKQVFPIAPSASERKHLSEGRSSGATSRDFHWRGTAAKLERGREAAIVAESFEEGGRACHVARRHGLTPQQLFAWRREARRKSRKETDAPPFVPALVEAPNVGARAGEPGRQRKRRARERIQSSLISTGRASGSWRAEGREWSRRPARCT
jgi:transposase-like protein